MTAFKSRNIRNSLNAQITENQQQSNQIANLAFDFNTIDDDVDDDQLTPWEQYTKLCFSQHPPIPAISLMKPILSGDEGSAHFQHMEIGPHISIVLQILTKNKMINDMNLKDNALDSSCVESLINFVKNSDQLSSLNLSDNPHIKAKAMKEIIEGIRESRSLEILNISNTGCNQIVGSAIANFITECQLLVKLDISSCALRQSVIEISNAIGSALKLKRLNLANNELCIGGKKLAMQLGAGIVKGGTITRLNLSKNAINDEMAVPLLKSLADSPSIKQIDLSYNNIGEASGKTLASLVAKTTTLKRLDISMNPILNVTINKTLGQKLLEDEDGKPGKKDKKPKGYTPAIFSLVANLAKNSSLSEVTMIGLIVDPDEWTQKLEQLHQQNQNVSVIYQAPQTESFSFQRTQQSACPSSLKE